MLIAARAIKTVNVSVKCFQVLRKSSDDIALANHLGKESEQEINTVGKRGSGVECEKTPFGVV